ncbi:MULTISPECIES: TetR/AcrR family transcriptional regulator [Amycolatopsis]|uniref:TetR/AcrR family transcriptional regulator n=1 Tax=Amycolatopsis TaxID=1813 RepID=UPI0015A50B9F|nr:TetR/AcrR family transcriptional regulator [Amycolatopsis sacchari]
MATPSRQQAVARRRPRDRKQQILDAAARQFWQVGYHQVAMADIAEAVDIGASALYRHFRGKQDLLVAVLDRTLVELDRLTREPRDLAATVEALARLALERREFGTLWGRDLASLPDDDRAALRSRLNAITVRVTKAVAAEFAHRADEARLRTHALYAVLSSPSRHHVELAPDDFVRLLTQAAAAVLRAPVPAHDVLPGAPKPGAAPQLPASRREAILAAAIRLFDRRGYSAVGITDISAAASLSGPVIYRHFGGKTEILVAALTRGNEAIWLALHQALAAADSVADALDRVLDSYATLAAELPATISVLLSEIISLEEADRERFRRYQQAYVHEWAVLLGRSRPELAETDVRVLVHAALSVVNHFVGVHRLATRPHLASEAAALARAVLSTGA